MNEEDAVAEHTVDGDHIQAYRQNLSQVAPADAISSNLGLGTPASSPALEFELKDQGAAPRKQHDDKMGAGAVQRLVECNADSLTGDYTARGSAAEDISNQRAATYSKLQVFLSRLGEELLGSASSAAAVYGNSTSTSARPTTDRTAPAEINAARPRSSHQDELMVPVKIRISGLRHRDVRDLVQLKNQVADQISASLKLDRSQVRILDT